MKNAMKLIRKHSEKITAFFLAAVFTFGFSVSVCSHLAFAADLGSYSDYNASNWEDVGEDARELAQSYLDVLKSTSIGNYFDEVTDIPMSWLKLASDGAWALSPISGIYYLLNSDGEIEVEHNKQGSTGTRHHLGEEPDDVVVDSDTFKKVIDETDLIYYPTGRVNMISWKTDPILKGSDLDKQRLQRLTFMYQGNFFAEKNLKDCYCVLFYYDGTTYYYSENGFHFYLDEWSDSSGEIGMSVFYDRYNFFDPANIANDNQLIENISNAPYSHFFVFDGGNYSCGFFTCSDLTSYLSNFSSNSFPLALGFSSEDFSGNFFNSTSKFDFNQNLLRYNVAKFNASSSPYAELIDYYKCLSVDDVPCDFGFIYSDQKFTMDGFCADIDTSKIPDNYYITISGDTIYDYSITNPETGQSSTVNEYMTNNYTYITNNPGGDGSGSSGTTGGNVTVGGNVGVNGNVNVGGEVKFGGEVNVGVEVSPIDINVNVSGNAGSSGAGESMVDPPEIGVVDDLVDYLPEKSPAINEYLKIFFDTLPPELMGLILAGVATAIIILIFRR